MRSHKISKPCAGLNESIMTKMKWYFVSMFFFNLDKNGERAPDKYAYF